MGKVTNNYSTIRRFTEFLRPHLLMLVILLVMVTLVRLSGLPMPMLYRSLIDDALAGSDADLLFTLIGLMAAIMISVRLLSFVLGILAAKVQQSVLHDVRLALYEHLQRLDIGFFKTHPTGGLLSRIMSDVSLIQSILSRETFELFASTLQLFVVGAMLVWLNPELSLISALAFPVLVILVAVFQKRLYQISKTMQEHREDLSARIQENLAGYRLIQTLAMEDRQLEITRKTSEKLRNTVVRSEIIGSGANLLSVVLTDIPLTILVWGYGGFLVIQGQLSLGSLLAFYQYLMMLYDPVIRLFRFNIRLQVARAALDRLYEVMDTEPAVSDKPDAGVLQVTRGAIRFEDVTLSYSSEEEDALSELNLELSPGEVLGLVGPSGSGKSTFVNGLCRFLSPRSGRILIDDQDLETVTLNSLRKNIGVVPQDIFFFSDTLENNIKLAVPDATLEQIKNAAVAAQADPFLSEFTEAYQTRVGERGVGLSGGERQRIALARVILQDPPILVFDEATSSLDAQSETLIQKALTRVTRGRTTVIIAHRFSTLKLCHRIAVLSGGKLVELGTHEDLRERGGLYCALLEAQKFDGRTL